MRLTVNGEPHNHTGDKTIEALLKEIGADPRRVVVMINGDVVCREAPASVRLEDGDIVEVLAFAGGG
jgi:thiazole synthase